MHEVKSLDFEYTKAWKNYPEPIKRRLTELNLSVSEVSRITQIPLMTCSRVLRGETDPFLSTAKQLASCLRMSIERFSEILEETQQNRARQQTTSDGSLSASEMKSSLVSDCELTPACSHAA